MLSGTFVRSLAARLLILFGLLYPLLVSAATPMVTAGIGHTIPLKADGTVVAWGWN